MYGGTTNIYLNGKTRLLCVSQKQLMIEEPPGSSLCCIENRSSDVLGIFTYECPYIIVRFNAICRLVIVIVSYVERFVSQLTDVRLGGAFSIVTGLHRPILKPSQAYI
jgi:hypothetical protein